MTPEELFVELVDYAYTMSNNYINLVPGSHIYCEGIYITAFMNDHGYKVGGDECTKIVDFWTENDAVCFNYFWEHQDLDYIKTPSDKFCICEFHIESEYAKMAFAQREAKKIKKVLEDNVSSYQTTKKKKM